MLKKINRVSVSFRRVASRQFRKNYTDPIFAKIGKGFTSHETVTHSRGEYARGRVTTNHVEGYFSILKRGLIGTFHHVGEQHLFRYVQEFDFKFNHRSALGVNDSERTVAALKGIRGKRLTYRCPRAETH